MWIFLIVLLILVVFYSYRWQRLFILHRWRKALQLDTHQPVYVQLFSGVDGFQLSRNARHTSDAMEYVYGEINFTSFIALLSLVKPDKNTVFYDLGSGIGTAVLACAMVFDVRKSCGVELFPILHHAACEQKNRLANLTLYNARAQTIHFINGDILQANFSEATLIFINATSFFGETWMHISQRIEQTTQCTTVISTSKALKSSAFTITNITMVEMSWGIVRAYVQQRKPNSQRW